jgi:DNA-binding HxlR family transcriptional regulator
MSTPQCPDHLTPPPQVNQCSARDVLDRIGDKWTLQVIYLLGGGTMRFTQLLRSAEGVSQRMLTVTLRGLERDGMIERTVYPVVPPKVEYTLTPLGRSLLGTVCALMTWAKDHAPDLDAARARYDAAAAAG